MGQKILRMKSVRDMTGLSGAMVYKLMAEKHFPASIALGGRAVGWIEEEVERWIAQKIKNARRAA